MLKRAHITEPGTKDDWLSLGEIHDRGWLVTAVTTVNDQVDLISEPLMDILRFDQRHIFTRHNKRGTHKRFT